MNIPVANATINVNQVWAARKEETALRRIRILAFHPDGGVIYEELSGGIMRLLIGQIHKLPERNLLKVFKLEQDVCTHRHTEDCYKDVGDYSPAMPNFYRCTDCGDLFPNTGDTELWFPRPIEE